MNENQFNTSHIFEKIIKVVEIKSETNQTSHKVPEE